MKKFNDPIYEMEIGGVVYRGSRSELTEILKEYRENHD